jgi:hypothetical protein
MFRKHGDFNRREAQGEPAFARNQRYCRNGSYFPPFPACDLAEEAVMNFNTTSFIAGVGSVVVVLSTGFAGGYFLANPSRVNPPNRLQRLAAEDHTAPAVTTAKPEVVATAMPAAPLPAAPAVNTAPAAATVTTAAPLNSATPTPAQPAMQAATAAPAPASADVKAPEPVRTVNVSETTAPVADKSNKTGDKNSSQKPGADADNQRPSEARFVERKRSDSRRIAEQQRKQQELEVATVAVRRIIHDRDAPDLIIRDRRPTTDMVENDPPEAPASPMPHFNLFGQ